MKTSRYFETVIFASVFAFISGGCSNTYYTAKPVTPASEYPKAIERAMKDKRYFIMQSGINIYSVTSVDVEHTKQQLTVTLDKVDSVRLIYFKSPALRNNKQNQEQSASPHEIHMYMKDSTSYTLDEPHTIPLDKVARIELLD